MGIFAGRRIDLAAIDIEGCLTPPNRSTLDLASLTRIQAYSKAAECFPEYRLPQIILVTGRPTYSEAIVQAIGALGANCRVPSVIEAGAFLYYPIERAARLTHTAKGVLPTVREIRKFIDEVFTPAYSGLFVLEAGKDILTSLDPSGISVEALHKKFADELKTKKPELYDAIEITHSSAAVDRTPKGVNKWSGLEEVLETHSINAAHVLGIGDSVGDAAWLEHVGIKAGPANATDELKAIGLDYISEFRAADGVFDILFKYILRHTPLAGWAWGIHPCLK